MIMSVNRSWLNPKKITNKKKTERENERVAIRLSVVVFYIYVRLSILLKNFVVWWASLQSFQALLLGRP